MNEIFSVKEATHVWGWELPVDFFFAQAAAGVLFLTALAAWFWAPRSPALRWARFAPPALLAGAMGALFLDLALKRHFWRFYAALRPSSVVSWGSWIILVAFVLSLVWALAGLDDAQAEQVARFGDRFGLGRAVRAIRSLGVARERLVRTAVLACSVGLGGYGGVLLSVMTARPLWNSALVGPLLLASGIAMGAATVLLSRLEAGERAWFERALLVALAAQGAIFAGYWVGLANGGAASQAALFTLLGGRFGPVFWAFAVGIGIAMPALLWLAKRTLNLRPIPAMPILVLAGGLAFRWIFIVAGQA